MTTLRVALISFVGNGPYRKLFGPALGFHGGDKSGGFGGSRGFGFVGFGLPDWPSACFCFLACGGA